MKNQHPWYPQTSILHRPRVRRHELDADSLFDLLEQSSNICSVDGDDSGEGGDGGGEPTYTKAQVEKMISDRLAKQSRSHEAKLSELSEQLKGFDELKAEFEKAKEEKELAGKTAAEQLEHKFTKELGLREKRIQELEALAAEREKAATTASEQLRTERIQTRLSSELTKAKVIPQFADKAVRLAMLELADVDIDENGTITASYGDYIEKPLAEVVQAWTKDNENFLPAPMGGAGTRPSNGMTGRNASYEQMTKDELASLVEQTDPNANARR